MPTSRAFSALVASLVAASGCGDDGTATPIDAGARDAAGSDAAVDAASAPTPPALPRLTPCPAGWREVPAAPPDGVATCEPFPEAAAGCGPFEVQLPGEPGCRAIGDACPADGAFPEGLPPSATIVYVRAGAPAGDGSLAAPFGTIQAAVDAAPDGAIVAIAGGMYVEAVFVSRPVTLWGGCVEATEIAASGTLALRIDSDGPVVLRNLRFSGGDSRVLVFRGEVEATGIVSEDVTATAWDAFLGVTLRGRDIVVRGSRGPALSAATGSTVEIDGAYFADAYGRALDVQGHVTIRRFVLRQHGIRNGAPDAFQVNLGGTLELSSGVLEDNAGLGGIVVGGADEVTSVRMTDVVYRAPRPGVALAMTDGIVVVDARATFERVRIEQLGGLGIFAGGAAELALTDVVVRDARTPPSSAEPEGRGVSVEGGASLVAERVLVARVREAGILASESAAATLTDVTVRDTLSSLSGRAGRGIAAQLGSTVRGTRIELARNREVSLIAYGAGVELEDVAIRETLAAECIATGCPDHGGIGAGAYDLDPTDPGVPPGAMPLDARMLLRSFVVFDNAVIGIQLARGGEVDLESGEVAYNEVGVNAQVDAYDIARLQDRVWFHDNELDLDASALPVPALSLSADGI